MAEGGLDLLSQVQERLLVCGVCLERYDTQGRTPRVLPCHHAFCTTCLQRLGRDGWVRCPSCRRESQVKGAFPVETNKMALLDLVAQVEAGLKCPSEQERCQPHRKKVKYSCSECKTCLCSKCAVFLHKGHDVQGLEQFRKQIEGVSERMLAAMPTFQGRVKWSGVALKLMEKSHREAAARIQAISSDLVARVQAKERQVLESLQARVEEDRAVLEEEHRGDQTLLKDAEALVEAAQGVASLQGSPSLLMSRVSEMERSCSQLEERASLPQQSAPAYQVGTGDESAWTAALESFGSISVKPRETLAEPACRRSADLETQKTRIGDLLKKTRKEGDVWYLLDIAWFKQWKKYVGYDSWDTCSVGEIGAHPGCIDNSSLLDSGQLRKMLTDGVDYKLLPEEAWLDLVSWYGLAKGAEPVARKMIDQGGFVRHLEVEVYPIDLKLALHSNPHTFITRQFSRTDLVRKVEEEMREVFHIPQEGEVRLWMRYIGRQYEHLNEPNASLLDVGLYHGQVIFIEKKNADGSWSWPP